MTSLNLAMSFSAGTVIELGKGKSFLCFLFLANPYLLLLLFSFFFFFFFFF